MLGYGPDEMSPKVETWSRNIHPEDRDQVMFLLEEHLKGRRLRYEAEYRLCNRNGHYLWVQDRGKVCERDGEGNPTRMVGMVQNITERKLLEAKLERLAHVDELTQLPNRRAAMLQLEKLLALSERTGHPLCLGIIDIDHFKTVNDQHGHAKGDQVLERVARTLQDALRRSDQIFRWGGEEFLLILPDTDPSEGECLAARLHQQLAALDWPGDLGIAPVTMSIGIVCHASARGQTERLLSQADAALYRAKALGRNRSYFAGELSEAENA